MFSKDIYLMMGQQQYLLKVIAFDPRIMSKIVLLSVRVPRCCIMVLTLGQAADMCIL